MIQGGGDNKVFDHAVYYEQAKTAEEVRDNKKNGDCLFGRRGGMKNVLNVLVEFFKGKGLLQFASIDSVRDDDMRLGGDAIPGKGGVGNGFVTEGGDGARCVHGVILPNEREPSVPNGIGWCGRPNGNHAGR